MSSLRTKIINAETDVRRSTLSKPRFEAFSDGVFAIAITLLILEIHLPSATPAGDLSAGQQVHAVLAIWPQYLVYAVSFATIGIMWLNHHALFRYIERITPGIALANLFLLAWVCFVPFATQVIGRFGFTNVAVVYYGLTMIAIGAGYNLLHRQVLAAHPSLPRRFTLWSLLGITLYPIATLIGYFWPFGGILVFGLLSVWYMLPRNIAAAMVRPAE